MPAYLRKISKFFPLAIIVAIVFSAGIFYFVFSTLPVVDFSGNISEAAATNTTIELLSPLANASTSKTQFDFQARITDPGDSNAWVAAYFYLYQATGTTYRLISQDWATPPWYKSGQTITYSLKSAGKTLQPGTYWWGVYGCRYYWLPQRGCQYQWSGWQRVVVKEELRTIEQLPEKRIALASGADLDVTYISRDPKYQRYQVSYSMPCKNPSILSPGKVWPSPGEKVTFTAHVKNKGQKPVDKFDFKWLIDGQEIQSGQWGGGFLDAIGNIIFKSGKNLEPGEEAVEKYDWVWRDENHTVTFRVDPDDDIREQSESNNIIEEKTRALSFGFWVEKSFYDAFNRSPNKLGSYSFEDWLRWQTTDRLNQLFALAKYPLTPQGILERVRIDKITVVADGALPGGTHTPSDNMLDGTWGFTAQDLNYYQQFLSSYEGQGSVSLIHELGHQLGLVDLYYLNVEGDRNEAVFGLGYKQENGGRMGGGDTSPYNSADYFSEHDAKALNLNLGQRRGYYGEYLYDIPRTSKLKILDKLGSPLAGAQIIFYQLKYPNVISSVHKHQGFTDQSGLFLIPNKPATYVITPTGHTQKDNPFGVIDICGQEGTFLIKIEKGGQIDYSFLDITQFNLAYWREQTEEAVYTIRTGILPGTISPQNLAPNKNARAGTSATSQGRLPGYAVDGNTTATDKTWAPFNFEGKIGDWWQVDLGRTANIYKINIYPTVINPHDWFQKFRVEISSTGLFLGEQSRVVTEVDFDKSRAGKNFASYIFNPQKGRYVRIISDIDQNWTELQEVEIFEIQQ